MTEVLLGLFSGVVFGFIIQRVGATSADRLADTHLLRDPAVAQFMLITVAIGVLGMWGLKETMAPNIRVLPTSIVATGLAAILFGIGWGLVGYCPGTTWAAVGEGRLDAVFGLLGGMLGAAFFAQVHAVIVPLLYLPTNQGQITLADWLGGTAVASWVLAIACMLGAWGLGRIAASKNRAA